MSKPIVLNFDSRRYLAGKIRPHSLGIFGSRTLADERVTTLILERLDRYGVTRIVTAPEPAGVCTTAQNVARQYGYPLELHFLNMAYLHGAFEQRSREILAASDYLLIIHDGISKGTANEKAMADKAGKEYDYIVLDPSPYKKSVGFEPPADSWDFEEDTDDDDFF